MTIEEVASFFAQRGIGYEVTDVQHGRQIKATTRAGECVTVYHSGAVVIGGRDTEVRAALQAWKDAGSGAPTVSTGTAVPATSQQPGPNRKIFVVYGHDVTARESVELILHRMGLEPVVLANLPASGDTIIEKLERYLGDAHGVGFACVILTPDDHGGSVQTPDTLNYRARQNVILELGMVLARLGRARVAILYKESVERPSDIDGLLYLPFKERIDEIKAKLFTELQAAGYSPNPAALS